MTLLDLLRPSLLEAADRREAMLQQLLRLLPWQAFPARRQSFGGRPAAARDLVSIQEASRTGLVHRIRYCLPGHPLHLLEVQQLTLRGWEFTFTIEGQACEPDALVAAFMSEEHPLWI